MTDSLTSTSFLKNESLHIGLFFEMARRRGYAEGEFQVQSFRSHRSLVSPAVNEITFKRGEKCVLLEIPMSVYERAARDSPSYIVEWIEQRFERDVLPMLARYPRPTFRIATRGPRRLHYDARTL